MLLVCKISPKEHSSWIYFYKKYYKTVSYPVINYQIDLVTEKRHEMRIKTLYSKLTMEIKKGFDYFFLPSLCYFFKTKYLYHIVSLNYFNGETIK